MRCLVSALTQITIRSLAASRMLSRGLGGVLWIIECLCGGGLLSQGLRRTDPKPQFIDSGIRLTNGACRLSLRSFDAQVIQGITVGIIGVTQGVCLTAKTSKSTSWFLVSRE